MSNLLSQDMLVLVEIQVGKSSCLLVMVYTGIEIGPSIINMKERFWL